MTFERLKARLDERPFRPLDLHTISGAKIRVSSREFAWLHPDHRRILIAASADEDREEMIDLKKIRKVSVAKSTRGSLSGISIELELCVANVFRMAEFLESAFGFERGQWTTEPDGRESLRMKIDDRNEFKISGFRDRPDLAVRGGRVGIRILDAQSLFKRLQSLGVKISEFDDGGGYATKSFRVFGPDDFVFDVYQHVY